MKALRLFVLAALLLALAPAAWATPADTPPEASLWGDIFDAVARALDSVIESVWAGSEATVSGSSGDEIPALESYPTIEPVGSPEAYPWAEPVGST